MVSADLEQAFLDDRPRLFQLAYRLMGSVADAEDALQDVFVRVHTLQPTDVAEPGAYLTRAVVRRCLDSWKSARRRREEYVGEWLPEPLASGDPSRQSELAESVSLAFLVMLESLNPVERAVFLLHDVFQYSFDEVAEIVEKSPAACRQIASRARAAVAEHRPRFPASPDEQRRLVSQFMAACESGSLDELKSILTADVTAVSDGGGKLAAARVPIVGIERVTRFILGLRSKAEHQGRVAELTVADVNGTAGIIYKLDGRLFAVLSFEIDGGQIRRMYSVLNPDKLASFQAGNNTGE